MYDTGRYEAMMVTAAGVPMVTVAATSTTGLLFWSPQCVPHIVRMIAMNLNVTPGDAGIILFEKRPTYSSDTSKTTMATINLATTHTVTAGSQPRIVYIETNFVVNPGEELVMNVSDASAATTLARVSLWVEAAYSRPLNTVSGAMVPTT
jgi:hypothetical protein